MGLPTDQKAGGSNPSRRAEHLGWSGPSTGSTTPSRCAYQRRPDSHADSHGTKKGARTPNHRGRIASTIGGGAPRCRRETTSSAHQWPECPSDPSVRADNSTLRRDQVGPGPEGSDMGERLLYRISEAADILGVSRSTLYRLIASGELLVIRVGSAPRIPAKVLERFVDQKVRSKRIGDR